MKCSTGFLAEDQALLFLSKAPLFHVVVQTESLPSRKLQQKCSDEGCKACGKDGHCKACDSGYLLISNMFCEPIGEQPKNCDGNCGECLQNITCAKCKPGYGFPASEADFSELVRGDAPAACIPIPHLLTLPSLSLSKSVMQALR